MGKLSGPALLAGVVLLIAICSAALSVATSTVPVSVVEDVYHEQEEAQLLIPHYDRLDGHASGGHTSDD